MQDNEARYDKARFFFAASLILSWIFFFSVAYLSRLYNSSELALLQAALGLLGLISPCLIAVYLFAREGGG